MDSANVFNVVSSILGKLGGSIGLLVLGLATAWLLLEALKKNGFLWQYLLGIYFIFFLFAVVIILHESALIAGGYALGNGIGLLVWGRGKGIKAEKPEEPKQDEA